MHLIYGKKGCEYTWQDEFPETVPCKGTRSWEHYHDTTCKGKARIAFVYHEQDEEFALCKMRQADDKLWLHDYCSVAIYFCSDCLEASVLWNQAQEKFF